MTTKRKRSGLEDFIQTQTATEPEAIEQPSEPAPVPAMKMKPPSQVGGGTVYRPPGGVKGTFWRKIREIAFEDDTTAQELITEGLKHVIKTRTGRNPDDLIS